MTLLDVPVLTGGLPPRAAWTIVRADRAQAAAHRRLRHAEFVTEQGLFAGSDADDLDDDPRTVVLVAVATGADAGTVLGGVRLAPATARDVGWWTGSRLVVAPTARGGGAIGAELVRRACATAVEAGVLRFDATVQERYAGLFGRLGWARVGDELLGGAPHARMRFPIDRIRLLAERHKAALAELLDPFGDGWDDPASLGGAGFVGDDGAPVPGTDVIAACDAILPALLQQDPEWAGWCGVLVNVGDLAAMGAEPLGLMNAIGAPDIASAKRVMNGLRSGSAAWGVPILGGHTQFGAAPSLTVTALGRTEHPIRGGGGRRGDAVALTADLSGQWRPGTSRTQWDSSSTRAGADLRALTRLTAEARPRAAKDVSMAGVIGTIGMLAEASGLGATVDVAAVPAPAAASTGDWLTCFPGFGMVTADAPGASRMHSPLTTTAEVGTLSLERGVRLRWPDGEITSALPGTVTGLGPA